jgi:uncharacterized protein GlcG (DUF336 family)
MEIVIDTLNLVQTAISFAEKNYPGQSFWMSIVTPSGLEILSYWVENNQGRYKPQCANNAFRKAYTANSTGRPTGPKRNTMGMAIHDEGYTDQRTSGNFTTLQGGVPIFVKEDGKLVLVGGLGISGLDEHEDVNIAITTLDVNGFEIPEA